MQYLGKISGRGVLQRMGLDMAKANYEIDVFRLNQGLVKASGEVSLESDMTKSLAGVSRMQLRTDAGHVLEIKRPNADRPLGRYFDFEVTGNLEGVGSWHR